MIKGFFFLLAIHLEKRQKSINFSLFDRLKEFQYQGLIESFQSAAPFQIPEEILEKRKSQWENFLER